MVIHELLLTGSGPKQVTQRFVVSLNYLLTQGRIEKVIIKNLDPIDQEKWLTAFEKKPVDETIERKAVIVATTRMSRHNKYGVSFKNKDIILSIQTQDL